MWNFRNSLELCKTAMWHTFDYGYQLHLKLCSITPVATKLHVILPSFVVLTWMHDIVELV